jgi:tetratricopeptide (TPR) repeat protein
MNRLSWLVPLLLTLAVVAWMFLQPKSPEWHFNRGIEKFKAGDWAGAEASYTTAIESPSFSHLADAYTGRGIARDQQGNLAGALEDHDRAIELKPDDARIRTNRGAARARSHDLAGALEDYNRALEIDPNWTEARFNRATIYIHQGKLDEAEREMAEVFRQRPDLRLPK